MKKNKSLGAQLQSWREDLQDALVRYDYACRRTWVAREKLQACKAAEGSAEREELLQECAEAQAREQAAYMALEVSKSRQLFWPSLGNRR